jgi:hypothetical protein
MLAEPAFLVRACYRSVRCLAKAALLIGGLIGPTAAETLPELVTRLGDSSEDQKSWELRPTEADMILLIPESNSPCLVD